MHVSSGKQLCRDRIVVHFFGGQVDIVLSNDVDQKVQVYPLVLIVMVLGPHSTRSHLFLGCEFYLI